MFPTPQGNHTTSGWISNKSFGYVVVGHRVFLVSWNFDHQVFIQKIYFSLHDNNFALRYAQQGGPLIGGWEASTWTQDCWFRAHVDHVMAPSGSRTALEYHNNYDYRNPKSSEIQWNIKNRQLSIPRIKTLINFDKL